MRRLNVRLDPETDALLRRVAEPGKESAWVRCAIIEKAARDEQRSELDALRQRLRAVELKLGIGG